jgi:hypothetical protein
MNIFKSVKDEVLVPIHPAGWPFIFLFILVSAIITYFWAGFLLPGSLLSLWCIYFFRNPKRTTPADQIILSSHQLMGGCYRPVLCRCRMILIYQKANGGAFRFL